MNFLKYLWQLPQNLIGFIISLILKAKGCKTEVYQNNIIITRWNKQSGLSLGKYIFVSPTASNYTIKHECGHSEQSLRLGWLY